MTPVLFIRRRTGGVGTWKSDDPASPGAARNLDWEQFLEQHDPLLRRVIEVLAGGGTMHDLKAETGWSDSTLSNRKRAWPPCCRKTWDLSAWRMRVEIFVDQ